MDMAFLRRAERMFEGGAPAQFDHGMLLAALAAQRRCQPCEARGAPACEEPLVALLLGDAGWPAAAAEQRGCFNRAEAGRHFNAR